jgi:hypothetical protein
MMKKLRLVAGCLALLTIPALLIPRVASAQSADNAASFTSHALVIGFLVLSVIVLVFLGLMLKARVNELKSFIRKTSVNKPQSPIQEMMRLDEEEIKELMAKRSGDLPGASRSVKSS